MPLINDAINRIHVLRETHIYKLPEKRKEQIGKTLHKMLDILESMIEAASPEELHIDMGDKE